MAFALYKKISNLCLTERKKKYSDDGENVHGSDLKNIDPSTTRTVKKSPVKTKKTFNISEIFNTIYITIDDFLGV